MISAIFSIHLKVTMPGKYTRQDLRKATKFIEGDYSGINPREFYRQLKRGLEEIQDGGDFKYDIDGNRKEDLEIQEESVGEKTGTVEARLAANSDWLEIGQGELTYRPYGPHGALGVALGALLIFVGLGTPELAVLGIVTLGAGVYGYWQEESAEFPIIQQDVIRVLIDGEVSERTVETDSESRTDIFANMSVVYAGDSFVAVDVGAFENLHWPLRRKLTNQVKKWNNEIVELEERNYDIESGFLGHLKSWTNRDVEEDKKIVSEIQDHLMQGPFEDRIAYTERLESELDQEMRTRIADHEEDLMVELEGLAEDLDIYIEREGLQRTSTIEEKQERMNRPLQSGEDRDA